MTVLLTYEGYTLTERAQGGYRSVIGHNVMDFDTAAQWKQFIDRKNGKTEKRNDPR